MEFKNQPIYKGVHKTLCINFRACAAFTFTRVAGHFIVFAPG